MSKFRALTCHKQLATHVFVGMGAASFWRGAWYLLDDNLFPDDPLASATASLGLGVAGMAASQGLIARAEELAKRREEKKRARAAAAELAKNAKATKHSPGALRSAAASVSRSSARKVAPYFWRPSSLAVTRFGALYTISVSCVLVWRGTWMGWDILYDRLHPHEDAKAGDRGHATHSGLLSHVAAVVALLGTGLFASVLAPPAAASVIRDFAVKTGSTYTGPAQALANRIFGGTATASPRRALSSLSSRQQPRGPSSTKMTSFSEAAYVQRRFFK